jgi:hypothetical protein
MHWTLGRHALFFENKDPTTLTSSDHQIYLPSPLADGAAADVVSPGFLFTWAPQKIWHGLADYTYYAYDAPPATNVTGRLVGSGGDLEPGVAMSTYGPKALELMFGWMDSGEIRRLHFNPRPNLPNAITVGEFAQMHAMLASRVSDFEVAFTADADTNGVPDTFSPPDPKAGQLKWYDIDNLPAFSGLADANLNPVLQSGTGLPGGLDHAADVAFVFRHDADPSIADNVENPWPYLIRVRYRIHDRLGEARALGSDFQYGRWFETYIQVNRD